jgi:hypothetical protein
MELDWINKPLAQFGNRVWAVCFEEDWISIFTLLSISKYIYVVHTYIHPYVHM